VKGTVPRGLVPPQPNLGPEPWPSGPPVTTIVLATAAFVVFLAGLRWWRLGRRRRPSPAGAGLPVGTAECTPRDQIIALSAELRQALALRLGPVWRAKTTEEVAIDQELESLLGREHLEELSRFLDRVDRLKFAPERSAPREQALESQLAAWQPRVQELTARIQTKHENASQSREQKERNDGVRSQAAVLPDRWLGRGPARDNGVVHGK
jgi:hypothetical protein